MPERFIVTGSGRCGTKYMSLLLSRAGLPCGHERTFNAGTGSEPNWAGNVADSSWMAVPHLPVPGAAVVLMARHPLSVVASLVEIGFFGRDSGNECHRVLRAWAPSIYCWEREQDRALAMWYLLTRHALAHAEVSLRLETFGPGHLARLLRWAGLNVTDEQAAARYASVGPANRLDNMRKLTRVTHLPTWDCHDPALAEQAQDLAGLLGYDPETIPEPLARQS